MLVFSDFLLSVFFLFPENHSNSSFYLHGTFLHLYRGALLFFYHTLRTKNTVTVVPFCEKVFSFDLFARVLRIPLFASRLLWRDFERQIGWTAQKHSERETKKRFWRQCPILNPMTARKFQPKAYTFRSEKIFSLTRSHRARFVRDFPRVTLASWCRAAKRGAPKH